MNTDERLDQIEKRLGKVELHIAEFVAANRQSSKLIKFVILPLIVILGALVGVKIM